MRDPLIVAEEHYQRVYGDLAKTQAELDSVQAIMRDLIDRRTRLKCDLANAWGEREMAKAERNKLVREGLLSL